MIGGFITQGIGPGSSITSFLTGGLGLGVPPVGVIHLHIGDRTINLTIRDRDLGLTLSTRDLSLTVRERHDNG